MNELTVPPEAREIETEAASMMRRAEAMVVDSPESQQVAATFLVDVKRLAKRVDETFDPIVAAAHAAHKTAVATKRQFTDPLDRIERALKAKIGDYQLAEQRRREAERRRLEEIARRETEEARLAQAIELEQQGSKNEAAALIEAPPAPVAVYVPPVAKAKGVSARMEWDFEIVDAAAVPREYCTPDVQKIRAIVRALGDQKSIPGVRVFQRAGVSVRA